MGKSDDLIAKIEAAHAEGLKVTADQYPWQASGTRISNALLPRWVKAGSVENYMARLDDPLLRERILEKPKKIFVSAGELKRFLLRKIILIGKIKH